MSIDTTTRMKSAKHVYARDFDGDLVLLDLAGGDYYGLDEIGARLWTGLMEGRTVADVAQRLTQEYDVEVARLEADLLELVRELAAKGLVEIVG